MKLRAHFKSPLLKKIIIISVRQVWFKEHPSSDLQSDSNSLPGGIAPHSPRKAGNH